MNTENTSLRGRVATMFTRLRRALGLDSDDGNPVESGAADSAEGPVPLAASTEETTIADGSGVDETETLTRSELAGMTGVSPEDYVQQLLVEYDGQLRQSDVSDLTRLSASTTSRLLSEMEADQQITRVSIGREKVVCLPSEVPDTPGERAA